MNEHDNNEEINESERVMALLALVIHSQGKDRGECLSDEQITDFINHDLEKKQRQKVLAHLNRCQTCYHLWLETASSVQTPSSKLKQLYLKLLVIREYFLDRWKLGVPVTVAALFVVAILWQPWTVVTISDQIDAGYAQWSHSSLQNGLNFPGGNALGFSPSSTPTEALAFQAGMLVGKATLRRESISNSLSLGTSFESSGQWADDYEFGRWIMLLWVSVTQAEEVNELKGFWQQQYTIAETFQKRFSGRSTSEAVKTLETIQPWLLKLQQQPQHEIYSELRIHLEHAIIKLSP